MSIQPVVSVSQTEDQVIVVLGAPATEAQKVGVWFGSAPGEGQNWAPAAVVSIAAGEAKGSAMAPGPGIPVWGAALRPDGVRSQAPVGGVSAPSTAPRAGSAAPAPARPCGCGGSRVRIVIEIDGAGQLEGVSRDPTRIVPGTGGVPVRCLTGNGTGANESFTIMLQHAPQNHMPPLSEQWVRVLYGGQNRGHEVRFGPTEVAKTVTSVANGARSAYSFDQSSSQDPPVSTAC